MAAASYSSLGNPLKYCRIIKIKNVPVCVKPGDFIYAKITDASAYDLKGEFVK